MLEKGPSIPRQAKFRVSPDALTKSFEGETVLVHMKSNKMHVLNPTASRLWELVCAGHSRAEIQEIMGGEFNVGANQLSDEIDRLLTVLKEENLIQSLGEN